MLRLQRASAGSGKTYMLAKKFLWFFLTIKTENGRRLRTKAEMSDSLSHILAITFTNKATAEMKLRIVEKLAALAYHDPASGGKNPDYLDEFMKETGEPEARIVEVAARGLDVLLNSYSDFNVSTIDSFFQGVLRTFAYEADLNDTYDLEIDSDYLAEISVDGVLDEAKSKDFSSEALYWLKILMKRASGGWNMFQRSKSSHGVTAYAGFLNAVKRLDNEDFKLIRSRMDDYFESGVSLREIYETLSARNNIVKQKAFDRVYDMKARFEGLCASYGFDVMGQGKANLGKHLIKLAAISWQPGDKDPFTFTNLNLSNGKILNSKTKLKLDPAVERNLVEGAMAIYDAIDEFRELHRSPEVLHWDLYAENFPYLGLLSLVREKRRDFLEENNVVELAETNTMLRGIISEDDAPFIYERLGTRLNHYLIDEFQDTSRLQWENLNPLLQESESRGNDNLIIGDAKQSIYRFRNADPSLITERVPQSFSEIEIGGMDEADNANWRSMKRIVEFNNFYFDRLSRMLAAQSEGAIDFLNLYANVAQKPMKGKERGYVEINFLKKIEKKDMGDIDVSETPAELNSRRIRKEVADLIVKLLKRGYRQRDIAVLVSKNEEAEEIIRALRDHNAECDDESLKIRFIAEKSLKVESSSGVQMILSALSAIASGKIPEIRDEKERIKRGVADWNEIKDDFQFFTLRTPHLSREEQLDLYLAGERSSDTLQQLVSEMQTVALPALVEAVTAKFVPEDIRKRDAVFISVFADIVLEYCERSVADLSSFLNWWKHNGSRRTIMLPPDTDAVQVMTIHKSKGLEFKCVIIPYLKDSFTSASGSGKGEWKWVAPADAIDWRGFKMPPYIPLSTGSPLFEESEHKDVLFHHRDQERMDILNKYYVAFTRAVEELYIYCWQEKREDMVSASLDRFLSDPSDIGGSGIEAPAIERVESEVDKEYVYRIGTPCEVSLEAENETGEIIGEYYVNPSRELLLYKEENVRDGELLTDEDPDPRSEGNLLHQAMSGVVVKEHLRLSLLNMEMQGLITHSRALKFRELLENAMARDDVRKWFDGSLRVLNERSIMRKGAIDRRPDRIMVDVEGNAIVVDYKFGSSESNSKYLRQVGEYCRKLLSTGKFKTVRGYLWYILENDLREVELGSKG